MTSIEFVGDQERMEGKRVNPLYRSYSQGNPLVLFLDIVPNSSAGKVTKRVAWMFPWSMKMRVKRLGLSA